MRKGILLVIFVFQAFMLLAQKGYHVYITMTPTVTFGTRFFDGSRQYVSPDNKTGVNTIHPLYSVLDGYPNPNLKPVQNLARKFTWGVLLEKYLTDNHSVNLGFEVGARGYKMHSERSISSLISYRNLGIPIYFSRYKWLGQFWTLKFDYGGSLNYAYSIPMNTKVVNIKRSPTFYPLLGGGVEMAYLGDQGKLSFELSYYHGWMNIIDHSYVGVDNRYGERVYATGSHLRLSFKYNFKRFKEREKKKKNLVEEPAPQLPAYDFSNRALKVPQEYKVKNDKIRLCFSDDRTEDGDSIVVLWNDSVVAYGIALLKNPVCLNLALDSGNNILVVHAINEGTIKPNTYQIVILDGKTERPFSMKSDMHRSAAAIFRKE